MPVKITVLNQSNKRLRLTKLRAGMCAAFGSSGILEGEANVLLAHDADLRELNHRHRGLDEATDVLTFPAPEIHRPLLGDVVVSIDFAERGARVRRVSVSEEAAFLAIHGALHLAGLDDSTETERDEMIRRMNLAAESVGMKPDLDWASQPHGESDDES